MRPRYYSQVKLDSTLARVSQMFDFPFDGTRVFEGWEKPDIPASFHMGLIVGPSGSGKSLLLSSFGKEETVVWDNTQAIVSQFEDSDTAIERLQATGLNSIPAWCSPFGVLSTGEQFRANIARRLVSNTVFDEFTSVVDRNVAKALCCALSRYVQKKELHGIVFASCHYDIISWLRPDWYFDTSTGLLHDGRSLQRPKIVLRLFPCKRSAWGLFKQHHYLSSALASSADCYLIASEFDKVSQIVGFTSCRPMPSGNYKYDPNAWIEHRTVVLPDFQGMGIGPKVSDMLAQLYVDRGMHYYSRTAHPRLGAYRDRSPKWRRTVESQKKRATSRRVGKNGTCAMGDTRSCFSHRYIGDTHFDKWWEV